MTRHQKFLATFGEHPAGRSVEPGYNSPRRVRASDSAFDGTPETGNAATGFVQRPAIPPRPQAVALPNSLEIAAEYQAIVRMKAWKMSLLADSIT